MFHVVDSVRMLHVVVFVPVPVPVRVFQNVDTQKVDEIYRVFDEFDTLRFVKHI